MSDPNYPGGSGQPGNPAQQPQQPQQPSQGPDGQQDSGQLQNSGFGYPAQGTAAPMTGARPGTATASGVIAIVLGALSALAGLLAAIAGGTVAATTTTATGTASSGLLVTLGIVLLIVGVLQLICGIMVLKRRNWARLTLSVLIVIGIIVNVVQAAQGKGAASSIIGIVIDIAVFALLWVKPTSEWFKGAQGAPQQ